MTTGQISPEELPRRMIPVRDLHMACVELGEGPPVVFQHGNPTSSYLWRNIMPWLQDTCRCIAIDLIGMGRSDKLDNSGPGSYTLAEHQRWFDAALDMVVPAGGIVLVLHDWGSALGFDWARRHPDRVRGICYMEAIVCPLTWDDWPAEARRVFRGLRSQAGEEMVLEKNLFVERILPSAVLRKLDDDEMEIYRRPFQHAGEGRRPTLSWPRQLPIDGEPRVVCDVVHGYGRWLADCRLAKLFVNADPGSILTGRAREYCRGWPNQREVTVRGSHFLQEDSPHEIGAALRDWYQTLA